MAEVGLALAQLRELTELELGSAQLGVRSYNADAVVESLQSLTGLRVLLARCTGAALPSTWLQMPLLTALQCELTSDGTLFGAAGPPDAAGGVTLPALAQLTMLLHGPREDETSDSDEEIDAARLYAWLPRQLAQLTCLTALTLRHNFGTSDGDPCLHLSFCDSLLPEARSTLRQLRELRVHDADLRHCGPDTVRLPLAIAGLTLLAMDGCALPEGFCSDLQPARLQSLSLKNCDLHDILVTALLVTLSRRQIGVGLRVLNLRDNVIGCADTVEAVLGMVRRSGIWFVAFSCEDGDEFCEEGDLSEVGEMWLQVRTFNKEFAGRKRCILS